MKTFTPQTVLRRFTKYVHKQYYKLSSTIPNSNQFFASPGDLFLDVFYIFIKKCSVESYSLSLALKFFHLSKNLTRYNTIM